MSDDQTKQDIIRQIRSAVEASAVEMGAAGRSIVEEAYAIAKSVSFLDRPEVQAGIDAKLGPIRDEIMAATRNRAEILAAAENTGSVRLERPLWDDEARLEALIRRVVREELDRSK
jgi:hypothetical protein